MLPRTIALRILVLTLAVAGRVAVAPVFSSEPTQEGFDYFEKRIRPLLVKNCFECHGEERQKAHLRLDSISSILAGGDSGPALLPGQPEKSLIIAAVRQGDADLQMPPKKKLTERQIADLTEWIKMGAPWPGEERRRAQHSAFQITEQDRAFWAFQTIRRPALPQVERIDSVANPIDLFILSKLEAEGLAPNPPATRRELVRRAYFDLIGLPPTAEQIADVEQDKSPGAYEKLIDRLLSLPQYGERWGRHWLDVVRYAQSNGYERDDEKPMAWRYRDYVIKSFNEDKPYDRFMLEQLAGDELPDSNFDSVIATGFYRLGVWDDEPDDKGMAIFDELDDFVSTTGTTFMGLTLGCARCHDHKFDPISQADYYQFLSFFRNVRPHENAKYSFDSASYTPLETPDNIRRWHEKQESKLKPLEAQLAALQTQTATRKQLIKEAQKQAKQFEDQLASSQIDQEQVQVLTHLERARNEVKRLQAEAKPTEEENKKLQEQISRVQKETAPFEWALSARENSSKPIATHILTRGNAATPGAEVQPAFLSVLGGQRPEVKQRPPDSKTTGLRLALAEWIASADNPLPARVMANRIWQHHFGRGIVKTTTDFGRTGIAPTHPELLDWLATKFIESGWSVKQMHKWIMLSSTYQMSSQNQNSPALDADPGNDLVWRQNLRRLEAEAIRDTVLSISGRLNLMMAGRGFFPHLGGEVISGASNPGAGWEISGEAERLRRTVYTFVKRTMLAPVLENFDYSNTTSPLGERPVTTVAPQALMLLNDAFLNQQAMAFTKRLIREAESEPGQQIKHGYRLALGREPHEREMRIALDYLQQQTKAFTSIRSRLTFRPDVPESLNEGYLGRLQTKDMVIGPRVSWSYHRGFWGGGYSGIKTLDHARGPFALWQGEQFSDGIIHTRIMLHKGSELAGVILRAHLQGHIFQGYDVVLDQRHQRIVLSRHSTNLTMLAQANASLQVGLGYGLKIEALGPRVRVWLNDGREPILDATDTEPITEAGYIGVRSWGAAVSLDDLRLQLGSREVSCSPPSSGAAAQLSFTDEAIDAEPSHRALQSFCLLLLNLNEVIYVD